MFYADATHCLEDAPLIAGRLAPIHRELPRPSSPPANDGNIEFQTAAVLAALASGRDTDERAIDYVVDRLLEELSW